VKRLVFLGILLLVAVAFRLDFLFVVFYLFALVYALSYLWVQNVGRNLAVERRLTDYAFSGDRVRVRLVLKNGGWLPAPWLDVHESLPVQLAAPPFFRHASSVGGKGRQDLEYELHCHERGYYAIGPLVVRTGDLMGFARARTLELGTQPLIVYPKVLPLNALGLPTHSPQVALPARSPLFQDPSRVMGVRDYQRGDSPRRLHWTATAKASARAAMMRLMVKQYQSAISRETMICLDLYREDYGRRNWVIATERAIVVAASLANQIVVRERLPVGLATEAHDPRMGEGASRRDRFSLPPRAGQGQLMRLLEVLAVAQVISASESGGEVGTGGSATGGFAAMLRETARDLSWGATLAIVTGKESPELFDTLFYLRRAGFAVALILVQAGRPSRGRAVGGRLGVPVYRVWEEGDLGGVLGQLPGAHPPNAGRIEDRRLQAGV
jgi:uncharacterized protein (DUF58 family)